MNKKLPFEERIDRWKNRITINTGHEPESIYLNDRNINALCEDECVRSLIYGVSKYKDRREYTNNPKKYILDGHVFFGLTLRTDGVRSRQYSMLLHDYTERAINNLESEDKMREFDTGATRDTDEDKFDYEGFLSPIVIKRFGEYMHKHRKQADGKLRDSDNWQKGIPKKAYIKSAIRHFHDWWMEHRGYESNEGIEEALCALLFNVQGYLHEHLKEKD
jgi:hypothetical protein